MVKGLKSSEDMVRHIIIGFVCIGLFFWIVSLLLHLNASSDVYLYDDENKFINQSLGDVEGNYKIAYVSKSKQDIGLLRIFNIFNKLEYLVYGVFVIMTIVLIFVGNRKGIFNNIKEYFYK